VCFKLAGFDVARDQRINKSPAKAEMLAVEHLRINVAPHAVEIRDLLVIRVRGSDLFDVTSEIRHRRYRNVER
jgi:hypothetical protein